MMWYGFGTLVIFENYVTAIEVVCGLQVQQEPIKRLWQIPLMQHQGGLSSSS